MNLRHSAAIALPGIVIGVLWALGCGSDGDTTSNPPASGGSGGSDTDSSVHGGSAGAAGTIQDGGKTDTGKGGGAGQGGSGGGGGTAGSAGTGGAGGVVGPCSKDEECNGLKCCSDKCTDVTSDPNNCGTCGLKCDRPQAATNCTLSNCTIVACEIGYADCDGTSSNGCETALTDGGCACKAGATRACYTGPDGTEGVGICKGGTQTCSNDGLTWGDCVGQVTPQPDSCNNSVDDDCNNVVNDGFSSGAPGCKCIPGSTVSCYTGPDGTQGSGPCKAGERTCNASGLAWGACVGEVLPVPEICGNNVDDNCDNLLDDMPDQDGDGWTMCAGDCCDVAGTECSDPALVNPGAFEVLGNSVDDDCDGSKDNPYTACDHGLASNSSTATDYAKAIDLCQTTTENPPIAQRRWGVISASLALADGTGSPNANSRSIRNGFGTGISPLQGQSLAVLSTGNAADTTDTNPPYAAFQTGQNMGTSSGVPADWLAANGGSVPNAPGCPGSASNTANDPVMLKVRLRVPTNARSFSLSSFFFSAEYPEWVCSPYNDFFVLLLDSSWSGSPANPADKNLAFYDPPPAGAPVYPVGVNLAYGNTGLFRQCANGETGCSYGITGTCTTCVGTNQLAGTGFDIVYGGCSGSNLLGGGTGWLVTYGNVQPGEVIEVRFAVWDTADHVYDSLVLLDNWEWSLNASQPGTGSGK